MRGQSCSTKGESMRFIVYGAGAIGAAIGGLLHESGYPVVLIARGDHGEALRRDGLRLETQGRVTHVRVPILTHPREVELVTGDVVLLAVKTQDSADALRDLAAVAPASLLVACAQNGVENERLALRLFERVYGISVMCPAAHLTPGVVQLFATPKSGILDLGRYPSGKDELAEEIAAAFRAAGFDSEARSDILRFKYGKLLFNLGNAIEAVCGPGARKGPIADVVKREALAAMRAAGIDFDEEGAIARAKGVVAQPLGASARPGGSSWQSLVRQTGSIETDYLNGEIVLIGRMAGVPTPANALLQRLAGEMARTRQAPGSVTAEEFIQMLGVSHSAVGS